MNGENNISYHCEYCKKEYNDISINGCILKTVLISKCIICGRKCCYECGYYSGYRLVCNLCIQECKICDNIATRLCNICNEFLCDEHIIQMKKNGLCTICNDNNLNIMPDLYSFGFIRY